MEIHTQDIHRTIQPMKAIVLTEVQTKHFVLFKDLYDKLFDTLRTDANYHNFYIKKIDGINVELITCLENDELLITIKSLFQDYHLSHFKILTPFDLFLFTHIHLDTLKYNTFYNILELPLYNKKVFEYKDIIVKSDNVELDYDECCVCLELTTCCIDNCDHYICLKCESRLENSKCPLCRQDYNE